MKPVLIETKDFAAEAAVWIAAAIRRALSERNRCLLSLCGGSTPAPVYALLAGSGLDWSRILVTFGDERCVPPDDPQSNHRMARAALLDPAGVPAERVLRMRGELDPDAAAVDYADALSRAAAATGDTAGIVHDVMLLGMGDDGHTASLFPDTAALAERDRDVVANHVPKFGSWRLTLTFPAINRSRQVCFLVNDPRKLRLVHAICAGGSGYPAESVRPTSGSVTWILGGGAPA